MTTRVTAYHLTKSITVREGRANRIVVKARQKNDLVLRFTVVDADGDAVDISGYTTRTFGVYPLESGTASFTKTPSLVGGGTGGQMDVTITDADLAALAGDYRLELQVVGTGFKQTLVTGLLKLEATFVS